MISIIVAMAENNVIGKGNDLPWRLSGDLKHFAKITTGNTVVMGSNTFKSIFARLGKALPNRKNVVLSSKKAENFPGAEVFHSIDNIIELGKKENVFIIGGAKVYHDFISLTDKLYITKIHAKIDGDTFFPTWNEQDWKLVKSENHLKDDKNEFDYTFLEYEKRK